MHCTVRQYSNYESFSLNVYNYVKIEKLNFFLSIWKPW